MDPIRDDAHFANDVTERNSTNIDTTGPNCGTGQVGATSSPEPQNSPGIVVEELGFWDRLEDSLNEMTKEAKEKGWGPTIKPRLANFGHRVHQGLKTLIETRKEWGPMLIPSKTTLCSVASGLLITLLWFYALPNDALTKAVKNFFFADSAIAQSQDGGTIAYSQTIDVSYYEMETQPAIKRTEGSGLDWSPVVPPQPKVEMPPTASELLKAINGVWVTRHRDDSNYKNTIGNDAFLFESVPGNKIRWSVLRDRDPNQVVVVGVFKHAPTKDGREYWEGSRGYYIKTVNTETGAEVEFTTLARNGMSDLQIKFRRVSAGRNVEETITVVRPENAYD